MSFVAAPIVALVAAASAPSPVAPCRAAQVALVTDGRDGDFNGMSHAGTLLVWRNVSARACSLPGLPVLVFRDARGRPLPVLRRAPAFMHPGPVVVPVTLQPGGEASTALRWVSGPVYPGGRCVRARSVTVAMAGGVARTALSGQLCGPATGRIDLDQAMLRPGRAS